MSKYSFDFKVAVVDRYVVGDLGYEAVGRLFGVRQEAVRKWVAVHRIHGVAGLTKKFSHYSAEFKLSVLRRMWDEGLSRLETAALFDIRSAGCLTYWEASYQRGGIDALSPRARGRPKSGRLKSMITIKPDPTLDLSATSQKDASRTREDLLSELNYLRMENAYLKKLEALALTKRAPQKRGLSKS
jgi:transposase